MSEFFLTKLAAYTAPEVIELKSKDWIQYGVDNDYFNYNGGHTDDNKIKGVYRRNFS